MKQFSGIVLFNEQNHILLGSQLFLGKPVWNCFFGSVELSDANHMHAAIRELDEETTNYFRKETIGRVRQVGRIKIPFMFCSTLFVGKIKTKKVPEISFEFSNFKWFPLNYLPKNLHPGLKLLKSKVKEAIENDSNYTGQAKKFIPKVPPKKLRLRSGARKRNSSFKKALYDSYIPSGVPFLGPVWDR